MQFSVSLVLWCLLLCATSEALPFELLLIFNQSSTFIEANLSLSRNCVTGKKGSISEIVATIKADVGLEYDFPT